MDSFSDRRGATAVCNVETYPQPCISNGPEKYCPVCLDQQQSLARPPRSGPSISKFFLPGNILLCVTEVFKPQVDHLSGEVMHYGDIQERNLDRKGQEKPKFLQKYPEIKLVTEFFPILVLHTSLWLHMFHPNAQIQMK